MISKIIFIFLFNAGFATASDRPLKCPKSELLSDHNNESILGCDAAVIALKLDSVGDKAYRNKINKNLAEIVAKQATQVLQTLGSSSAYFENNNKSFLVRDSPEVAELNVNLILFLNSKQRGVQVRVTKKIKKIELKF